MWRMAAALGVLVLVAAAALTGAWWARRGADEPDLAACKRALAGGQAGAVWRLAAAAHAAAGDHEAARAAHERALRFHQQSDQPREALQDAYGLYASYWSSSDYGKALTYAGISLEEARRAGDTAAERHVLLAIFTILYDIGDLASAAAFLRMVQPHVRREDGDAWLYARFNEGLLRKGNRELEAARAAYADVLASAPPAHALLRATHLNLVEIALLLGDATAAANHLQAALSLPEDARPKPVARRYYRALVMRAHGDLAAAEDAIREALQEKTSPDWAWRLHHELGMVRAARGDEAEARAAYGRAIDEIEALRRELGSDALKDWLIEEKRAPYEALFALEARRGAVIDALSVAERARARTFLDAAVHAASSPARTGGAPTLQGATERFDALRALLPDLHGSPVAQPRPMDEILDAVRGRHILIYFEAEGRLWLATAGASPLRVQVLPTPAGDVHALVSRLLVEPDDPAVAKSLGEALLPEDQLGPAGSILYVVADGTLGELPFAALRLDGRYVVDRHPVVQVPSLNALAVLQRRRHAGYGPAVVLGDPRGDLPGAAQEATAVSRILDTEPLRGDAATTDALREAARADVLHLAAHAGFTDRGAWIELADGRVDARAVLSLGLRPRLAVLASCTSAAQRVAGVWGSLAAAFLAAGSQAVLATLWSVDDEVARRFVLRFYQEGGARDPARALARAQRAFAAEGEPPSAWAPFVLVGAPAIEE